MQARSLLNCWPRMAFTVRVEDFSVVIPARFASTRLPGKPLLDLAGRAMIVRVAEQARASGALQVVVATDHHEIAEAVLQAGFEVEMTAPDHPSGSDRVMEVARRRGWSPEAIVINVQGDEPLLPPAVIRQLGNALTADPSMGAATLCEPMFDTATQDDPNVVKVVRDADHRALYFSRAAIPHVRDAQSGSGRGLPWLRHLGIYGYRVRVLQRFVDLPSSPLEQLEALEQLRLLENGINLSVFDACEPVPGGVDTPQDVQRVLELLEDR